MKKILALAVMLLTTVATYAVTVQEVYLKNGSVLTGYIKQQDKKENITFSSDNAAISIAGAQVVITNEEVPLASLEQKWVDWANKNDAFNRKSNGELTLTLSKITLIGDSVTANSTFLSNLKTDERVRVLEKGSVVKYLELTPNEYKFNWSEVESIKGVQRVKNALSGIDRVYHLKNGQVAQGQYAGESYSTLSLYNSSGVIETYNIDDVVRYEYIPINENQSIFEQSELLDVVSVKNGDPKQGIIVERNFTQDANYLVLQLPDKGGQQVLKFADVAGYSKVVNPAYNPKFDIFLAENQVVINRQNPYVATYSKEGSRIVIDSINTSFRFPKQKVATRIEVEVGNPRRLSMDRYMIVGVKCVVTKTLLMRKVVTYCFSTDLYDMVRYNPVAIETSANNTTKLTFDLPGEGIFALYDQQAKKVMPFIIK
jgi:hypothetical protein